MRPLRRKLLALLLQLPPSLTTKEGLKKLEALIHNLDADFRYAIEVRHKSWFDNKQVYKLLSDNNICLAWSQLDTIQTPPELTSVSFTCASWETGALTKKTLARYRKIELESSESGQTPSVESRTITKQSLQSWQLATTMLDLVLQLQARLERCISKVEQMMVRAGKTYPPLTALASYFDAGISY
jgi:Protein of unknown function DUF72